MKKEAVKKLVKMPLVELAGHSRVLVENHQGILAYSMETIAIKVCFGRLVINGNCLKLMQICKEQLVITGQIDTVALQRG